MCALVSDMSVVAREGLGLFLSATWVLAIELRHQSPSPTAPFFSSPRKFLFLACQNSNFMRPIQLTWSLRAECLRYFTGQALPCWVGSRGYLNTFLDGHCLLPWLKVRGGHCSWDFSDLFAESLPFCDSSTWDSVLRGTGMAYEDTPWVMEDGEVLLRFFHRFKGVTWY